MLHLYLISEYRTNTHRPIKNLFRRGNAGDHQPDTHVTPSPDRNTAGSDGKVLSSRPSTWASREARESRSARFQEDEMNLVGELDQLIRLKTASPTYVVKRLADLPSDLNDVYRERLLKAARLAIEVAYAEYERDSKTGWENLPGDSAFDRMSHMPFAEVRDFQKYVDEVNAVVYQLSNMTLGVGFFEAAAVDCKRAQESADKATMSIALEVARAQMVEIRWAVERKCMYWAAVAMMNARIDSRVDDTGHAGGSGIA
jgi:hypothetical protein